MLIALALVPGCIAPAPVRHAAPEAAAHTAEVLAPLLPPAWTAALADEVNRVRANDGAPPLRRDERLDRAAADFARELAGRRLLSHESETPERRTLSDRLYAVGLGTMERAGENLARIPPTEADVARRVVYLWLRSPAHRGNVLHPGYELAGVGAARADDGDWYVAQLYAAPLAERPER